MAKLKICDYMENKKKRKITFESLSIRDRVRKMSTKKTGQNKILKINKKQTIKLLASKRKKIIFIFNFFSPKSSLSIFKFSRIFSVIRFMLSFGILELLPSPKEKSGIS